MGSLTCRLVVLYIGRLLPYYRSICEGCGTPNATVSSLTDTEQIEPSVWRDSHTFLRHWPVAVFHIRLHTVIAGSTAGMDEAYRDVH